MELHAALVAAVPNGRWVEYIPQLGTIAGQTPKVEAGVIHASDEPGLGIDWDWEAVERLRDPALAFDLRG